MDIQPCFCWFTHLIYYSEPNWLFEDFPLARDKWVKCGKFYKKIQFWPFINCFLQKNLVQFQLIFFFVWGYLGDTIPLLY